MITATYINDPIKLGIRLIRGTDQVWTFRRIDEDGNPIIPASVKAQIRDTHNGVLWLDFVAEIDPVDGWITLRIADTATADKAWNTREVGVWDMEVIVNGVRFRWVEGNVLVSQDVTR